MSTSVNLASGQFITSINGKRCTAVPKAGGGGGGGGGSAATTTASNNNSNNGGNVQATPSAAQAASSSTTDSTTTTSTLVESTSTSTTFTSTSISTSTTSTTTQEANAGLAPAVQETTTDSPPGTTSSALPTNQNIPVASSPQPQAQAQTTPVSIQDSQADTGVIATLATAAATTGTSGTAAGAAAAASSASGPAAAASAATTPQSITNGNGAAIFSTISAPPGATDDGPSTAAAAAAGDGSNPALSAVTSTPGTNPETTIAIAGGVIGGVAFLSLVAFLVWFWRRRMRKRRRSTLLTPLSVDPATFGGPGGGDGTMRNGEKGEYVINRGSIGPTPKSEKIKATFDYNVRRIKGRFGDMMASRASNGSVNMDRGNSQFMGSSDGGGSRESNTMNNVAASNADNGGYGAAAKDRVAGWFGRLAGAGAGLASKFRGGSSGDSDGQDEKRAMGAQPNGKEGQPDFLTLLGMDERELERAAQNKKNSKKKRASMDRGRYGSSSNNDYLGRLNIDFDDPFSDTNAIAHQPAKPTPLTVSQANNPFSDANAIGSNVKPNTYVANIRRSRGQNDPNFQSEGMYRDSIQTVATVDTSAKRNRFRSDPFDLERPELLQLGRTTPKTVTPSNMSVAGPSNAPSRLSGGVGTGEVRRPRAAHQSGDSFTSKYSSGVSMGDWSDPGPDVGPSAPMWGDSSSDRRRDSSTKGRTRSNSDESSNSVGKAL